MRGIAFRARLMPASCQGVYSLKSTAPCENFTQLGYDEKIQDVEKLPLTAKIKESSHWRTIYISGTYIMPSMGKNRKRGYLHCRP